MSSSVPEHFLDRARRVAVEELVPHAEDADQGLHPPMAGIEALAREGLMGVTVPREYGGLGATGEEVRRFVEIVASGCGLTAFLLFQHVGGCRHVATCDNEGLKRELLPRFASGERFLTLAFSHLRRPGPPSVRVDPEGDGWVFNGTAPWATGWGMGQEVLLAGTLPDGDSLWSVVPLAESESLRPSAPMRLCAADLSATVSLELRELRVGPERVVRRMTPAELSTDTAGAILFFTALSLGAAGAAVRFISERAAATASPVLQRAAATLGDEIETARAAVNHRAATPVVPGAEAEVLRLRAWCIDLGVRAAHAAVAAGSGASNGLNHPAQRLFREAMLYTLTAQTRDLQAATLEQILSRSGPAP